MQDYTAKSERTAVEKLIQDQTGKDYKKFRNDAVAQAIGELIQGNTPTRRAFEKKWSMKQLNNYYSNHSKKTQPATVIPIVKKHRRQ